jgi:hypothetical protein
MQTGLRQRTRGTRRHLYTDCVVSGTGIIGAIEICGFFGRYLLPLEPLFVFFSLAVVLFSVTAAAVKALAGILDPSERRTYTFYILTNGLTPLLAWTAR